MAQTEHTQPPKTFAPTAELSREEWLAFRRKGIGGSDAASVLGISPFRTGVDLYYRWCLNRPEAVVAYQTGPKEWAVNNCDTEITVEQARIEVCGEWGFETSRVHIIGTPYYDASDYQFIRFDCAHMTWLWHNGSIDQVYH